MKTLIIGGTGLIGSAVVKQLQSKGAQLRLLVRKAPSSQPPAGTEIAVADLLDPVAVGSAMQGVDKLFLLNAVTPDELTQGLIAYDLARRHQLQHVVYWSVFRVEQFKDVPHFAAKLAIEAALRQFDVPYTVLRPNYFFQNDVAHQKLLTEQSIYPTPLGRTGVSAVDVRDLAEAAAAALLSGGHSGKTYNLTGPDLLSGPSAAAAWSAALGTQIKYPGEDMEAFEQQMRANAPGWAAFDIRMMFQGYLERGFVAGDGDVAAFTALLGHEPRRYVDFVKETVAGWRENGASRSGPAMS
jgi:uncharacterized protein YbjT (DUF2867 family)